MKKVIRVLLVVCLLGGAGFGIWYWQNQQNGGDADELVIYGNVDVRQVELAINGNERIGELLVEEGDRITKGNLLGKLNTERLEYAVERAKAIVESQRQVVARLEAGSRPEEIAIARADVTAAKATALDKKRNLERIRSLVGTGAVTQEEFDDNLAAYESAEAQVNARQAELDLAVAGPRKEDKEEAKALLKRYEAELAQAEHDLKDSFLYAPSDGIIQDRILEVGDMASPQKTVFTVALTDPVWVRAYVSEPDLGKIHEGMKARVITDSFPDKEYEGWIGFISPTAEFTPKPVETRELRTKLVYQIRVFVKNPNNELRLGMPATVKIPLDQSRPSSEKK
ncbi:Macrolide export protein MacA [Bremerella volcania]|uniref:Macrolide export protein MacA n=1 Tax=Bremerella volcania TaxID=2527984 RepID=A0A518C5V0_9BACT|nr:efflux RND transporter periplasmic adaptor subunit [Bremerella volcania]QDU74600.1 Macrolide export protein MacA [Bremerella volcania]